MTDAAITLWPPPSEPGSPVWKAARPHGGSQPSVKAMILGRPIVSSAPENEPREVDPQG